MRYKELTALVVVLVGFGLGWTGPRAATPPAATPVTALLAPQLVVHCPRRQAPRLSCTYRLSPAQPIDAVAAIAGDGRPVTVESRAYPGPGDHTAVLFLVDTGNPQAEDTLARQGADLVRIIGRGQGHHRMGLATLDSELVVRQPLGTDPQDLLRSVKALTPTGSTSELYRTALNAVRLLAAEEATRRALFLFSDGRADDQAYFHQDVVAAARAAGVVVFGLGYPRSAEEVAALQTLRRLSEDTGGAFQSASPGGGLPGDFLDAPFAELDSGGNLRARVPEIPAFHSQLPVRIRVTSAGHTLESEVGVAPPTPAGLPGEGAPVAAGSAAASPSSPETSGAPPVAGRPRHGSGLESSNLVVLTATVLVFGASAVFLWRRRSRPAPLAGETTEPRRPAATGIGFTASSEAYFTRPDSPEQGPVVVSPAGITIGRNADNDLRLDDASVSRHHARVGWDGATGFHISDLGSLNGIYVNDRQVKNAVLKNGDRVEVGDIRLQFHLGPPPRNLGVGGADPDQTLATTAARRD